MMTVEHTERMAQLLQETYLSDDPVIVKAGLEELRAAHTLMHVSIEMNEKAIVMAVLSADLKGALQMQHGIDLMQSCLLPLDYFETMVTNHLARLESKSSEDGVPDIEQFLKAENEHEQVSETEEARKQALLDKTASELMLGGRYRDVRATLEEFLQEVSGK